MPVVIETICTCIYMCVCICISLANVSSNMYFLAQRSKVYLEFVNPYEYVLAFLSPLASTKRCIMNFNSVNACVYKLSEIYSCYIPMIVAYLYCLWQVVYNEL